MLNIFFIQKLFTTLLTEKTTVLSPAKLVKKSNNQSFRSKQLPKNSSELWKKQLKKSGLSASNL